ncbi:MerR family transcriptional regulator [Nonomuraea sp. NN258]|uniref:TioE family transcriptional regulator n=1 Tax=Nonomuraea antri TaxID=2730852 RepID=UPI00156A1405|nr:TioE family transcriptional regulator [Nonomuraea antri]NRQ35483.1 MerR family transcriptional regulator [Nonomuraea antri]
MARLRPVDLAREHGLSTQAVRNYEEAGILPPAGRSPSGYRVYTGVHAEALRAFVVLVPAHGHATATAIMQAVNRGADEEALRLIDESHVQLLDDRRTLAAVERALRDLSRSEPGAPPRPSGPERGAEPGPGGTSGVTFIGPLARRLGLRPATLRKWERAGIVRPERDRQTGYRVYAAADVRDARLAHQLRRGGYPLEQIAALVARIREAGGLEPLESTLSGWRERLTARGLAMLTAAAGLDAYLGARAAASA